MYLLSIYIVNKQEFRGLIIPCPSPSLSPSLSLSLYIYIYVCVFLAFAADYVCPCLFGINGYGMNYLLHTPCYKG